MFVETSMVNIKTFQLVWFHLVELLSIEEDNGLFYHGGGENSTTAMESDIFQRYVFTIQ